MCGRKESKTTNEVTVPPEVMARYNAVNARAEEVAATPFKRFGNEASDFVAQINDQQRKGIAGVNAAANSYQPYIDAATGATYAGMGEANAGELDISKYMSPYIQNVADTTGAMLSQENARAQSGNLGTAISSGAFGGDRAGIAAANLSQQQNLAYGKTMADIYNEGYNNSVGVAQQQQGVNLAADQANLKRLTEGGAQLGNLGISAQAAGIKGAEAQINAGSLEQQTEQAGKTALLNQFMQEQGFPFQVAQFLANIAMGTGALSGSTTETTQPASFWSDRRLKHDIKRIGKTDDGLPIYSFKYKGDENQQTHIGFMADEVEKVKPEAVGVHPTGYKTVDYDKATENSMGGGVAPQRAGEAFADGGVAGPYGSAVGSQPGSGGYIPQAYLPVGDLIVADPAHAENAKKSMSEQLASIAALGESARELKGTWDWAKDGFKTQRPQEADGGAVGPQYLKPQMGGLAPNTEKSYLTDTLASQDKSDKPKLDAAPGAGGGGSGSSPAGDIAALAKIGLAIAGIPLPFRNGGAAGYADGGAPVRDEELDLGAAIRALGRDAVGYKPGMVDPGLASAAGMTNRPTGVVPDRRLPDLPTQEDLDRRFRESSAQPDRFPNEPTSPNRYTPLPMDYGRPLYETQLGATNTLVPRPSALAGPEGGVYSTFVPQPYVPLRTEGGVAAARVPERVTAGQSPGRTVYAEPAIASPDAGLVPAAGTPPAPAGGLVPAAATPTDTTGLASSPRPVARPEGLALARAKVSEGWNDFAPVVKARESGGDYNALYKFSNREGGPFEGKNVTEMTVNEALEFADPSGPYGQWVAQTRPDQENGVATPLGAYQIVGSTLRGIRDGMGLTGDEIMTPELQDRMAKWLYANEGEKPWASSAGKGPAGDGKYVGLGLSTRGQAEPQQGGLGRAMLTPDKPYEDRSMTGKIFYNRDGTLNRDAIMSGITGIGAMLSSPSQFFLPSLGLGLQGFAGSYAGLEQQRGDITAKNLENMRNIAMDTMTWNETNESNLTPSQYAEMMNIKIDIPGNATAEDILSGAYTPTGESGLKKLSYREFQNGTVDIGGRTVAMENDPASLQRFISDNGIFPADSPIGRQVQNARDRLNEINASGGRITDVSGQQFQAPGYTAVGNDQAKAVADREATAQFRTEGVERTPQISQQLMDADKQALIFTQLEAGSLTNEKASASAVLYALGLPVPEGAIADAAMAQEAVKIAASRAISSLGEMSGSAPKAELDQLAKIAADPDMQPEAVKMILTMQKAALLRDRARYSLRRQWEAENPNSAMDQFAYEQWFDQNKPYSAFYEEAKKGMPRFAGETGTTEKKPHIVAGDEDYEEQVRNNTIQIGDYVKGPDDVVRKRVE